MRTPANKLAKYLTSALQNSRRTVAHFAPARERLRRACQIEGLETRVLMSRSIGGALVSAPAGLSATPTGTTSVQVNWVSKDSSAKGFYVLRSQGAKFAPIGTIMSPTTTSFVDTSVTPNTTYKYEVQAFNSTKTSAASKAAAVTTPMAAPSELTATALTTTSAQLKWKVNAAGVSGYYVLRSVDGKAFARLTQINSASASTYVDKTISRGHTYAYEVQAFKAGKTSAVSNVATLTITLAAPSGLNATMQSGGVQLTWTDNDAAASGYYVLRLTDGGSFTLLTTLNSGAAASFVDSTMTSGHAYDYVVQAFAGSSTSAASNPASVTARLAAPSSLSAAPTSGGVLLAWAGNDSNAAGYYVFRSNNGGSFSLLATVNGASNIAYTDTSAASAQTYTYQVQAFTAATNSTLSDAATVTTPMAAPTSLTAILAGMGVNLSWSNNDSATNGYLVMRSTDGVNFSQIAQISSAAQRNYTDAAVVAGQRYYYSVNATSTGGTSAASNVANVTLAAPSAPATVTITTRFSKELVITGSTANDMIAISQSGSTLTIIADGQSYSLAIPQAGVFVYTRGGADGITIDSSVTVRTTIQSIDAGNTMVVSAGGNVSVWADSTDTFAGSGVLHRVSSFAGGVSKALGAAMANPSDAGTTKKLNASLWGTGPVAADVNQGGIGDCYFLASLAGFAGVKPSVLLESAVDMGDGTYTVQFSNNGLPMFVRISNDFSTGYYGGYAFAHPGASGAGWAMVLEKAFCYFRSGDNTYDSLNAGWMNEVYSDFGVTPSNVNTTTVSETSFYNNVSASLAAGKAVTFGTNSNVPNLVGGHAYTLISASIDSNGVTHYVVRNPWGVSGDALENSFGYATLTFAQIKTNFLAGTKAA